MKIFHRYIWHEFFTWFLICGLGFTVLGLGKIIFDYNDLFIGYNVPVHLMVQLIVDQIPTLMMDILPAASIFGAILGLGRLLRERELDVMSLSGASMLRIMFPVYLGVAFICFGAYWWNDYIVPAANNRFQKEVQRLSLKQDMPLLKENVVFKGPNNRFIYLRKVDRKNGLIWGIMIIETKADGQSQMPRMITAETGEICKGNWNLMNGVIHELDEKGAVISELTYEKLDLKMSNDISAIVGEEKSPSAMRSKELLHLVKLYRQTGLNVPVYTVYYYSKFADPIISLIFMFLAIPLTINTGKNSLWLGLVYCFLIIMAYYAMQVIGRTMGSNSVMPPWAAVWAPHAVFFIVGTILFVGMERRR